MNVGISILLFSAAAATELRGQSPLFDHLPVGPLPVGFKIMTLTDSSRVAKPEFDYFGNKVEGSRLKKVTVHIWYPGSGPSASKLTYADYCYNQLLTSSDEKLANADKEAQQVARRRSVEGWFGKASDANWQRLMQTEMLASTALPPMKGRFPLLIGMLRPLSTSLTNEVLASNGYMVAMVKSDNTGSFAEAALTDIPDMQFALGKLQQLDYIDKDKVGVFGFSGSGFIPVLFSMFDLRVQALADLESGLYMDNLFQALSASNFYKPSRLRVPFLHIFSTDLSKQEKFLSELESKTKFSRRYRLLLNQPALHHWDFASEGYSASKVLGVRGAASSGIEKSFEVANTYLLRFFDAELKKDQDAVRFFASRPVLPGKEASLWDMTTLQPVQPPPSPEEFEQLIRRKGIDDALRVVRTTLPNDSTSRLYQGFVLNNLGYTFLNEKKFHEAVGIFVLNTELHPEEANFFDSLSEAYEATGDTANMKKAATTVLRVLQSKTSLTNAENSLKTTAQQRLNR
jgi:hypothetical protein